MDFFQEFVNIWCDGSVISPWNPRFVRFVHRVFLDQNVENGGNPEAVRSEVFF